jgi:phage/plasmid primase-like uncharacterized protein
MTNQKWKRVTKGSRCPICERPDWCLIAADGNAAICAHIESVKRCGEAGWLHRLCEVPWWPERRAIQRIIVTKRSVARADLPQLVAECQRAVDPRQLTRLAASLGLSHNSLVSLRIGWSAEHRAWAFPMLDADGHVLGIRLRRSNGFKFSVTGGKEGLFLPAGVQGKSSLALLLICEGPTDAAALLDFGFTNVVGRPSCTGGIKLLLDLVREELPSEVVIVADNDEPGRRGADNLASALTAYAPAVRTITPPPGIKDARAWLQAGGTRRDVEEAIRATPVRRLTVRTREVRGGK